MGCGSSTPVKEDTKLGKGTTAASHANLRTKDGSGRGPELDVGPEYKISGHLGAWHTELVQHRGASGRICRSCCKPLPSDVCAGRGGTGDTWSATDTRTGKLVAIKFIKRPMPKVLVQNIQREFTVGAVVVPPPPATVLASNGPCPAASPLPC